ncbi:MAG: alpha/beta fold hydrolase [Solirubrobacterales bacterium]
MAEETVEQTRTVTTLELLDVQPPEESAKPPVLFVHGAGHGAWCWQYWMDGVAAAGYPAYAVSLRGHGESGGSLLGANLGAYVDDVIRTAATLPRQPVIVGHSLGGLVVQKVVERYPARAAVLVAPVPARPGVGTLLSIARKHPLDAAKILAGGSLPMRSDYLFEELDEEEAAGYVVRTGRESAVAQFQVLLHKPGGQPLGGAPMLVLGTPEDNLVPISDVRHTASHFGADLIEFPGMGHDLMLDARREEPMEAMIGWLDSRIVPD